MQLRCPEQVALVTLSGNHLTQPQLPAEAPFRALTEKSFAGATHLTSPRSRDELNYRFIPPLILAWPVLVLRGIAGHQPRSRHQHWGWFHEHPALPGGL